MLVEVPSLKNREREVDRIEELEKELRIKSKVIEQLKEGRDARINQLEYDLQVTQNEKSGEGRAYETVIRMFIERLVQKGSDY